MPSFIPAESAMAEKVQVQPVRGGTRIEDQFSVPYPVDKVWAAFADMPAVAACLPGAQITEQHGDSVKGRIQVKLGPMRASFAGAATLERDEAAKRGVIRGAGQDSLSSSHAKGDIAYALSGDRPGGTLVRVSIDYSLQGPLAQFSRGGLVRELVGRMVAEFAANLERQLASGGGKPAAPAAEIGLAAVLWGWLRSFFGRKG
jgi:carbon-monoxide dehydrogenase small subunit